MDERDRDGPDLTDGPTGQDEHRMPTWVRGFLIVGVVIVVLLVVVMAFAGGEHGPGRHLPGGGDGEVEAPGGHEPPSDVDHG